MNAGWSIFKCCPRCLLVFYESDFSLLFPPYTGFFSLVSIIMATFKNQKYFLVSWVGLRLVLVVQHMVQKMRTKDTIRGGLVKWNNTIWRQNNSPTSDCLNMKKTLKFSKACSVVKLEPWTDLSASNIVLILWSWAFRIRVLIYRYLRTMDF